VVTWSNAIPDSAVFGTNTTSASVSPYTVLLNDNLVVQDMTFGNASNGAYYNIADQGDGAQTLTLNGNILKTATSGGTVFQLTNALVLSAGAHVVTLQDSPGDVPAEMTMDNAITGAGSLTLDNGFNSSGYPQWGTLVLNADSDYSGGTNIVKGRLVVNTSNGLGTGPVTISSQGNLAFGGAGTSPVGNLNITNPITITRDTYSGTDYSDYPDAITSSNTGNPSDVITLSGPLTVDSTNASIAADTSTIVISSNIQQGPDVTNGVLTVDGDYAGFITLSGDNSALTGGIQLIGGVELNVGSLANLGGATATLNFNGSATFHPVDGFISDFGTLNVNYSTFAGGIDVDDGQTFTINQDLGGTGNTTGSIGKRGLGTLTLGGTDILGGSTYWDSGTVNVTGSVSLGSLHLRSPNVNITGTVTTTNGYSSFGQDSTGTNGGPDMATVTLSGTGALILTNQDFNVSDNANTAGTLILDDSSTVTAGANSYFGKSSGATSTVTLNGTSVYTGDGTVNIADASGATGTVTLNGTSMLNAKGTFNIGGAGGTGSLTLNDSATVTATTSLFIGGGVGGGSGTITVNGGVLNANKGGAQTFAIAGGTDGVGYVYNNGGTINVNGEFWDGNNVGSQGLFDQTSGTTTISDWFVVGRNGATSTLTVSGGTITRTATNTGDNNYISDPGSTTSAVNVSGTGSIVIDGGQYWLGNGGDSAGTLNISENGSFTVNNNWLAVSRNTSGAPASVINLSGGSLTDTGVYNLATSSGTSFTIGSGGSAVGIVNQTGGILTSDSTFVGENGTGTLNISGGTSFLNNTLTVGTDSSGNGTFNVNSGADITAGPITIGWENSATGVVNLNGGLLTAASVLGGSSTAAKTFNFNGGTLEPSGSTTSFMSGLTTANVEAGGAIINTNGDAITIAQPLVHAAALGATPDGGLSVSGGGTLTLVGADTYTGGTNVTAGTLVIGAAGALPANSAVSITAGTLQLAANTGGETLASLSIAGNGTLDIGNNHMILSDPSGSIDSTIESYLAAGFNGSNWNGTGGSIMTSAPTGTIYGIGWADGADGGISGLTSGQLEVKYTLYGDTNLDGAVNSIDFGTMAANFGKSGNTWDQGDFDYNGTINSIDFGLLAGNFGKSLGSAGDVVTAADWAALDAFAQANGLMAEVPEPASMGMLAVGGFLVLRRRRNR
jgi:autotransporter-associated beta strand protein/T5SS/PEP-CTERM-associated repeat protein